MYICSVVCMHHGGVLRTEIGNGGRTCFGEAGFGYVEFEVSMGCLRTFAIGCYL